VNTPHPDLETLAELADRESAPASETAVDPRTAELLDHVAGCAACTADLEALRRVRETLRALPPVPMPADVAERIEAALLAARASAPATAPTGVSDTVVPLRQRSKPAGRSGPATSRWRTLPYGAAASIVVLVALIVVGIVGLGHGGSNDKRSASAPALAAPAATTSAGATTIASGTNYTAADIRSQVASVVTSNVPGAAANFPGLTFGLAQAAAGSAAAPAAASSAPAAATSAAPAVPADSAAAAPASSPALAPVAAAPSAGGATGGTPDRAASSPLSAVTAPGGPLADPAALAQCIQILAGTAEQPILVDYATFNGAPSTIIVLPDPDVAHKLDVYVIADTTNCASQTFTFETFIGPSPGP
jgi:hypothetical protein